MLPPLRWISIPAPPLVTGLTLPESEAPEDNWSFVPEDIQCRPKSDPKKRKNSVQFINCLVRARRRLKGPQTLAKPFMCQDRPTPPPGVQFHPLLWLTGYITGPQICALGQPRRAGPDVSGGVCFGNLTIRKELGCRVFLFSGLSCKWFFLLRGDFPDA